MTDSIPIILDGGLATELEKRGHRLDTHLWSARLLKDHPETIRSVHLDYLVAGADCVTSASYQATIPGFAQAGLDRDQSRMLLRESIRLAKSACREFEQSDSGAARQRHLVAASIGPWGAYLADGSEYTGNYRISPSKLREFHLERWLLLAEESPDVMLCETIPSRMELETLVELARQTPELETWISVCCRDENHLGDGTPLGDVGSLLDSAREVQRLGVNCVPPDSVAGQLAALGSVTDKPLIAYPNSGETWLAERKQWSGESTLEGFEELAQKWLDQGLSGVGGCCRTGPEHIAILRNLVAADR